MKNKTHAFALGIFVFLFSNSYAQYKEFKISANGDTINAIDKKNLKQGKWVTTVGEIRGEPGYDEEGIYKDDKKEGIWRRYSNQGDLLAMENYKFGGKDGVQQYFSFVGALVKEEEWHSYNPYSPYDTIPIYGVGSNEIVSYKIVKAKQYSVPHGIWKTYEPNSGRVTKVEKYDRGLLIKNNDDEESAAASSSVKTKPKAKVKPQEILDYEKKYSKKKRDHMERDGKTGY